MCPPEHLHDQAGWDGSIGSSRERLLSELSSEYCVTQNSPQRYSDHQQNRFHPLS
jgi:hypothetical protein